MANSYIESRLDVIESRRKLPNKEFERTLSFRDATVDDEKRSVELSFSSEEPVERVGYMEVLSHERGHVDLSRLGDNEHPLLLNHDPERQIGVIENARIDGDKRGRATARFSRSALAEEVWKDVQDGIRRKVSVRYQLTNKVGSDKRDGVETVRFAWKPVEVSIVSIPADATVGIGRNDTSESQDQRKDTPPMSEEKNVEAQPQIDVGAERSKAASAERARIAEITAIAKHMEQRGVADANKRAESAINEGWGIDKFRAEMINAMPEAAPVRKAPEFHVPEKDIRSYSIFNLVRGLTTGRLDGLEREISDEMNKVTGHHASGAWLPHAALLTQSQRDNLFVTAAVGGNISPTNLLASEYIDALRNRAMVIRMGCRVMPGLQGTVLLPRLDTPAAITAKTEGVAFATSTPTFGQVTLSPKIAPALVRFTKLLAVQSNPAVEALVRDDLIKQINVYLDNQALNGSGSGGNATGVAATGSINTWTTLATGTPPTWSNIVDMETQVAIDNADIGALGYLINPSMRGLLKALDKGTDTGQFVCQPGPHMDGMDNINGYKAGVTNQVLKGLTSGTRTTNCSSAFFGNWNDLILGFFGGGIDLTVDNVSTPGWVALHGQQFFDVAVRHPESFFYTSNFYSGTVFNA